MAKVANLSTHEGVDGQENEQPKFEIHRDKIAHRLEQPPAEPEKFGTIGRIFSPEQMRQPVPKELRPKMLIGDLIREGDFATISGQSGTGKSAVLTRIGAQFASPGSQFMDHPRLPNQMTRPLRTLYVDLEMDEQTMRERSSGYWGDVHYMDTWSLLEEKELDDFMKTKEETHYQNIVFGLIMSGLWDVLIIDSYSCLVESTTERRHLKPFLAKVKRLQKLTEQKTGRKVTIILISHNRQGEKGESANAEMAHGDTHFTNFLDVVLVMRHGRNPGQSYLVNAKPSRNRAGHFTGSREQGDGECLVFTRYTLPENEHGEQFGLALSKEVHFEKDVAPGPGKGATDAGRSYQAAKVAEWMNRKHLTSQNQNINPDAVARGINRDKIDLGGGQKTISSATLVSMADEIREHLNAGVKERLSNLWG